MLTGLTSGLPGALGTTAGAGGSLPGTITSIVGGLGGPGPGPDISTGQSGLAFSHGDLFLADFGIVRALSAKTDVLSTVVGPASGDASRDGGLATSFEAVTSGIVVDRPGNLLLSAPGHLWVAARSTGTFYGRAMVKGRIYAVAKLAKGTSAQAVDSRGNLVLADRLANKVLVLALRSGRFYGRTMVAGRTYPVAGTGRRARPETAVLR